MEKYLWFAGGAALAWYLFGRSASTAPAIVQQTDNTDGTVTTTYSDGTQHIQATANGGIIPANGGARTLYGPPLRSTLTVVSTVTNPDGSITTTYSDGSTTTDGGTGTGTQPTLNVPHPGFRTIPISPHPVMSGGLPVPNNNLTKTDWYPMFDEFTQQWTWTHIPPPVPVNNWTGPNPQLFPHLHKQYAHRVHGNRSIAGV